MFPRYYKDCDVFNIIKFSTTHWWVSRLTFVKELSKLFCFKNGNDEMAIQYSNTLFYDNTISIWSESERKVTGFNIILHLIQHVECMVYKNCHLLAIFPPITTILSIYIALFFEVSHSSLLVCVTCVKLLIIMVKYGVYLGWWDIEFDHRVTLFNKIRQAVIILFSY